MKKITALIILIILLSGCIIEAEEPTPKNKPVGQTEFNKDEQHRRDGGYFASTHDNDYLPYKEILLYSDYNTGPRRRPSRLVPGLEVVAEQVFRCPKDNKIMKQIEHGEIRKHSCGLTMQVYGNALYIWKTEEEAE